MVGYLKGTIHDQIDNQIILLVGGVGYLIEAAGVNSLMGEELELYIYTHVREDDIRLFGFKDKFSVIVFRKLISISGLGPKLGLKIIDKLGLVNLIYAVNASDYKALKIPGIGEKIAQKIVIEMKDFAKENISRVDISKENRLSPNLQYNFVLRENEELADALKTLGFKNDEIELAFKNVELEKELSLEKKLKRFLDYLKK